MAFLTSSRVYSGCLKSEGGGRCVSRDSVRGNHRGSPGGLPEARRPCRTYVSHAREFIRLRARLRGEHHRPCREWAGIPPAGPHLLCALSPHCDTSLLDRLTTDIANSSELRGRRNPMRHRRFESPRFGQVRDSGDRRRQRADPVGPLCGKGPSTSEIERVRFGHRVVKPCTAEPSGHGTDLQEGSR
jgi:hypothetical protein